jgi:hypothetical protein
MTGKLIPLTYLNPLSLLEDAPGSKGRVSCP